MRKLYLQALYVLMLCLTVMYGNGQKQIIGSFPYMDGGFENQSTGNLGTTLSASAWTRQNQSGLTSSIVATGGRSGPAYATVTGVTTASRGLQSPQTATTSAGPSSNTSYIVQFYVRNSANVNSFQGGVSVNGTTNPNYSSAAILNANAGWTIKTFTITTQNTAVTSAGIGIIRSADGSFDIDDFTIYPGSAVDNVAPDPVTTQTTSGITSSSITVNWAAPSTGTDGGGYVVLRYTSDPTGASAPNVNGIYAVNNTIGTGTVAYIGTATSFTDNSLSLGTQYYYAIYTVDKAFNYSTPVITSATTSTGGVLASATSLAFANTNLNANSAEQNFTVSGSNLTGNLIVTAPSGFLITTTSGSNYTSTVSLTPSAGNVASTTIYAVFAPTNPGNNSTNLTVSSTGYASLNIAVSGYASATYQSRQSGNWGDASTWQYYNGTSWVNATTATPNNNDISTTIQNGHTLLVNSSVSVGQVTINGNLTISSGNTLTVMHGTASSDLIVGNGGVLLNQGSMNFGTNANWEIQNGSTYIHNISTGTTSSLVAALTIDNGSTFIYRNAPGSPSVSGRTFYNLSFESTAGTYTVSTSGSFTVNGKLTIGTNVVHTNTSTVTLNGDADIKGSLTTTGFSIATGKTLSVYPSGVLTIPASATITVGSGSLVLLSDATGTGTIGNSAGSISGNVLVQRYVGSNAKWRMIGFPFINTTTIGATALSTQFGSGYRAYTYNESADNGQYGGSGSANAGWVSFTGASTTTSDKGLLLLGGTPSSTLNASGALNIGAVSVALSYSSGNVNKGWNLIANPYPSNIDWSLVYGTTNSSPGNLDNAIYRYDPSTTGYASYVNGVSAGSQTNIIENGASFFVHSTGATSLNFVESNKTSTAVTTSLMGIQNRGTVKEDGMGTNTATGLSADAANIIKLSLAKQGDDYGDEVVVRWGGGYAATDVFDSKYDAYDLGRKVGPDLSVIGKDATVYSIFHGSELKNNEDENRSVQLGIKNMEEGIYQLTLKLLASLVNNNKAYLYDQYTGTYTQITNAADSYTFSVTADAKSASENRFAIVLNAKNISADVNNSNMPVILLNNPSTNNQFTLYSKNAYDQLQYQVIDHSGRVVVAGQFNNIQQSNVYKINAANAAKGHYFIRIIADGILLPTLKALKN